LILKENKELISFFEKKFLFDFFSENFFAKLILFFFEKEIRFCLKIKFNEKLRKNFPKKEIRC